jgi:hypothetical protein
MTAGQIYLLVLRIIHIGFGVFWAGSGIFTAWFLAPAVKAAGPDGGKVMGKLSTATRWPIAISAASGLTVLSGILLYVDQWADASKTPAGIGFAIGGFFGLIAAIIGGAVLGRTSGQIVRLAQEIQASAGGPPPPEKLAEMGALQARMERFSNIGAIILTITVIMMAISPYL